MKRNLHHTLLLFLTCLAATGCVKDVTTLCNAVIELKVSAEVEATSPDDTFNAIGVYVFDEAGIFVGFQKAKVTEQGNGQVITLSLPPGKYTLITWCGSDFDTDYRVMAQTSGGLSPNLEKGVTRLADMRLQSQSETVVDNQVGNLFWGQATEVNVNEGVNRIHVDTRLVRNTNQIEIVLADIVEPGQLVSRNTVHVTLEEDERYTVELTASAGVYKFDNSLDQEAAPTYTYLPYEVKRQDRDLMLKLKTMRLFIDQPVDLEVKDRLLNRVIYTADLMELIRQNPAYRTQEAIDKEGTFQIVIARQTTGTEVNVTITVNGWKIERLDPNP